LLTRLESAEALPRPAARKLPASLVVRGSTAPPNGRPAH
jgi:hypothetical protein